MAKIYLHGWNYRGQPFARAVRKAKKYGFDGIEAFPGHFSKPADPLASHVELKRIAESEGVGLPVASLQIDLITDDGAKRRQNAAWAADYVGAIAGLGFELLNGWIGRLEAPSGSWSESGSMLATDAHFERAIEGGKAIAAAAEKAKITVVLELHMVMIHDTAKAAQRIINGVGSPRLRANYDPGNMHGYDHAEPPKDAIAMIAPILGYAHLKNCRRMGAQADYHWPLWGGDLDYFAIIKDLYEHGFRGPYCLEYSGGGDRDRQTREDITYLREVLAEVEA